jgi:ABC-type sugar transport system permease subunit
MKSERNRRLNRGEATSAAFFLGPSAALLAVFVFWPMLNSVELSFFNWNPLKIKAFVGGANYAKLFSDKLWWTSFQNTLYYIVLNVPLIAAAALGMALLVTSVRTATKFFRGVYFLPSLISLVATGIVWQWLMGTNNGVINSYLRMAGLEPVKWFSSTQTAMISIVIVTIWRWAGYYMVIIVAGINGISGHYYEAADIEGANAWQKFRWITLPFLYPVLLFIVLMSTIGSFQEFDLFYMITLGGPGTSTYVTGLLMWQTAFTNMKMGYASAMSTILFLIILGFTLIQNHFGRQGWEE